MDRVKPLGLIEKSPRLAAWRDALLAAPAVKASTVPNIEAVWQEGLILRKRWLKKFVPESVLGADAAA
jgi:glutathione S-transferase